MAQVTVEPVGGAAQAAPAPTQPEAAPTAGAPAEASGASIPDEVLDLPPISAILAGEPAALSADLTKFQNRPEGQVLAKHAPILQQAGIGFYKALDDKTGVMFNRMHLSDQEVMEADKQGKLAELAPSYDEVSKMVSGMEPSKHPAVAGKRPTGLKTAPKSQPDQSASASAQQMKTPAPDVSQKMAAQALGSPSSGPKPGSGRILNNILKPVV